jgi:polyisoprenoid-binding protein YceI
MVISKVYGQFSDYDGELKWDGKDLSTASVEATIQVPSIDTQNANRDRHLRSSEFFAADGFPTITFKSTKVIPLEDNKFQIVGDLTIRGVTKQVTLDGDLNGVVADNRGNTRAGFSAATTINRQDYGVSWSKTLDTGGLVAGNDVEIILEIEAVMNKDQ